MPACNFRKKRRTQWGERAEPDLEEENKVSGVVAQRAKKKGVSWKDGPTMSAAVEMLNKMRIKMHCWTWKDGGTGDFNKPLVTWGESLIRMGWEELTCPSDSKSSAFLVGCTAWKVLMHRMELLWELWSQRICTLFLESLSLEEQCCENLNITIGV